VLGGLMLHANLLPTAIADGLTPETFAAPGHAAVFKAMLKLGVEPLLARPCGALVDELHRAGDLRLAGGPAGVVTLIERAVEAADEPGMCGPAVSRLPALIPLLVERVTMLARARRVQAALREAHAAVVRDPAGAPEVLATLRRGAR
jgi:hypothetical protein